MYQSLLHKTGKRLLTAAVTAAMLSTASSAGAWWGPVGPYPGGWDPHEAYLEEYGFLDRYGPSIGDIRRRHRDNWKAMMGRPVYLDGVGPYGPTRADVRRQYHRKLKRLWGYPY